MVQAVCASATPTSFVLDKDRIKRRGLPGAMLAGPAETLVARATATSAVTYVSADAPPILLVHGTADTTVNVKHGDTFHAALKKAGADVKIKVIQAEAGVASNPIESKHVATEPGPTQPEIPAAETAERTIDISSITLAPNLGNLFDPVPAAEAPDLDLSEYVVAENDGSFIVEPTETVEVERDLFAYTVADNDGSDLFEAEEVEQSIVLGGIIRRPLQPSAC